MVPTVDYFFGSFVTPQEQRRRMVSRNGIAHVSEIYPRDPAPGQAVTLVILSDAAQPIDHISAYYTVDGSDPAGARGMAQSGAVADAILESADMQQVGDVEVRRWRAVLPGQPDGSLVRYRIDGWSASEPTRHWTADAIDPFAAPAPAGREFAYHVDRRSPPDWLHDAIVYHIFVDRFNAASDQPPMRALDSLVGFFGGTIRGITEKIEYIASLGVNCIWLSPVMESPTYHSYNPSDYFQVSRHFGSNDDLRALIAAAHARGMRVLLDFVANHTSNEHPAFLAARRGEGSRDWYTFSDEYRNGYLTFYDVAGMPVLNTESANVRQYLIAAARSWLEDFGADGVRLDNVSGPTHAFWTLFQEGVKAGHPDALTLGEVSGDMHDIASYAGRLDAVMDFPLTRRVRQVFALRETPLNDLLDMLDAHEADFPGRLARARMLDNHDMHRFLWLAENDTRRLALALTFLMAIPGTPIVYYGTEVGLSQRAGPPGQDAYAREPMPWDRVEGSDLLAHIRWLIAQRNAHVSLRRGKLERAPLAIIAGDVAQVGALVRWTKHEAILVAFNNSETPARFTLDQMRLPFASELHWVNHSIVDAWLISPDGASSADKSTAEASLPPFSGMMFVWKAHARP